MNTLNSKQEADLYFERIAEDLEAIAEAVRALRGEDRDLAARLMACAQQIRIDSGLLARAPQKKKTG